MMSITAVAGGGSGKFFAYAQRVASAAVVVGLCVGLGGCPAEVAKLEASAAQDLPQACAGIALADSTFQTLRATQASLNKPLAAVVINDEAAAMAGATQLCTNPTSNSPAALIAKALAIYSAVMQQLATAKGG